jgi:hypothetical protein
LPFYQLAILPTCHFIYLTSCQPLQRTPNTLDQTKPLL